MTVSIDTTQRTALSFSLGQQLDDYAAFDAISGAAPLAETTPRWFRVHAGADNAVLPETRATGGMSAWNFSALDRLIDIAYQAHASPILNIRTAPISLSSCTEFHSGAGTLNDDSFGEFADYVAALVAYFNVGSYTDSNGITHSNPFGTTHRINHWELWNEPDLSYEFPCLKSDKQPSLSPSEFARMWLITTQRMLAIDPTIKFVGPAVSDPRDLTYLRRLLQQNTPPNIISFHGYAGANSSNDISLLSGGNGALGIAGIASAVTTIINELDSAGLTDTPILLDEYNVSPDGEDDPYARGWDPFGVALGSHLYIQLSKLSTAHPIGIIPFQFVEASGLRLASLNPSTGIPMQPYWRDWLFGRNITEIALKTDSSSARVQAIALSRSDASKISVLIANADVISTGKGTHGQNKIITLKISDWSSRPPISTKVTMLDRATPAQTKPVPLDILEKDIVIRFDGHGMALIELSY